MSGGVFDGAATVGIGDDEYPARVRLTGHLDPIDGRFHWRGAILESLPDDLSLPKAVRVTIGDRSASGRIVERTPQGHFTVVGVGSPPFPR